ncbi:MAG TPA: hypothetical protein VNY51_13825 [Candidatus Dormibacteraeota bacterium]|nr:hypothetical protein [Candidatus Dormibacteraeota bacterium]
MGHSLDLVEWLQGTVDKIAEFRNSYYPEGIRTKRERGPITHVWPYWILASTSDYQRFASDLKRT